MGKFIRLVIADNNLAFVTKLCETLESQTDIKVVEVVRDGQGAVEACNLLLPDLVLMDLRLPVLDSVRAVQSILSENERIKILVTSGVDNDRYAVEAVKVGASGYVEKNGDPNCETIVDAIRQVAQGDAFLNPTLATSILEEFHRLDD